MTQYNTLLLDRTQWDLVLDSAGNIAMTTPPYALMQDVASACRLFAGELWYNTSIGIPYFDEVLGHNPPASLMAAYLENAALRVPGVISAQAILGKTDRNVTGAIEFTDDSGVTNAVNI